MTEKAPKNFRIQTQKGAVGQTIYSGKIYIAKWDKAAKQPRNVLVKNLGPIDPSIVHDPSLVAQSLRKRHYLPEDFIGMVEKYYSNKPRVLRDVDAASILEEVQDHLSAAKDLLKSG